MSPLSLSLKGRVQHCRRLPDKQDKVIVPFPTRTGLNMMGRIRVAHTFCYGVKYPFISLEPHAADSHSIGNWSKTVTQAQDCCGNKDSLRNITAVLNACSLLQNGALCYRLEHCGLLALQTAALEILYHSKAGLGRVAPTEAIQW